MKAENVKLPQARQDELFIEQLGDELLVYDAKRFRAHRLNTTAAWMWRHCDGQKTVAETTQLLADELQQPVDEELVWLSLETLDKAHLLCTPLQRPSGASPDSRRAMIKMAVAGGLMLLLPAITTLTQPAQADETTTPFAVKLVSPAGSQVKTPAILGTSDWGSGVRGESQSNPGVYGRSERHNGVVGISGSTAAREGAGVQGDSENSVGVSGVSVNGYGVKATAHNGTALYARHLNKGRAGFFEGDVEVTGDIRLYNADCAEDFDILDAEAIEAGAVMVLSNLGGLELSGRAYDKRVAGVISGAGDYQPGLILDKRPTGNPRKPVALMGKVYCKVDASYGAIEVGDLLTTSDTPGHAMKATDTTRAFGSVLGKALRPWADRQGLIPILVTLQ